MVHRSAVVHYAQSSIKVLDIQNGTPPGSILGPLLFIVSFNDIIDVIEGARIVKYADNTVNNVAYKYMTVIKTKLSKNMNFIADWLYETD